ncbi:MAG: polysaccharide biosynthesis tyrosine autokinase [Opitutus sp.]|nr:polysaccharide biosynthesis tyrosine autokinase [Opitutus sp.]
MADSLLKNAAHPSGARDDDSLVERRTLRDYYIILRERLWIALPLALLVAVPLGYFKARETPMYLSTATMQFEKPGGCGDLPGRRRFRRPQRHRAQHQSPDPQQRAHARPRPRFLHARGSRDSPASLSEKPASRHSAPSPGAAMGSLSVEPVRNTLVINVSVRHPDAQAAALVANRYVREFMTYLIERVGGINETAVDFLRNRAEQLRRESEEADQRLQAYMKAHNLVSLDRSRDLVSDRLKTISGTLTSAQLTRLNFENQYKQVQAFTAEGRNLIEIQFIAEHGSVPSLKSQLASLRQNQSVLADRYFERHPRMVELANSIAIVEEQLQKAIQLAIADLGTRLSEARASEKSLQVEFDRAQADSLQLGDLAVEFKSLENQAQVSKSNYLQILDRLNQTTTTKNLEKIPLHPLDPAVPAGAPYAPNMKTIVRTCIGVGVLVFVGVAVGLSFIDDRIKSAWDVESFIGVNLLGIIPDLSAMKDDEKYALLVDNKQAPGVEAFLSVYSSVKIHSKLDFPKSILVTSTIPGEGKTLVSCNLAGSFARHGKRTLLIDCDLRRPMLHRHFKQQNTTGVITWFESGATTEGELATNPSLGIIRISENLSLLCSGGRSKSPTEILESPAFAQLLERLKHEYELVVVDSPPLGAVTDSLLIAERTDEVIYVCRFNRAYRKHIRLYIKALKNGKNEVLGVVLNGLSPRRIEYYSNYRYYRSYKKYYGAQT